MSTPKREETANHAGLTGLPGTSGLPALRAAVIQVEQLCAVEDPAGPLEACAAILQAQAHGRPALEARVRLAYAWGLVEQRPSEARVQIDAAAKQAKIAGDAGLQAHAQCLSGRLAVGQSDAPTTLRCGHQALKLAQAAAVTEHIVHAHSLIGIAHLLVGDHARALVHQEEVLRHLEAVQSPSLKTVLLCDVGASFNDFGTPDDARTFLERALTLVHTHALHFSSILVRENLGRTLLQLGEHAAGTALLQEGLTRAVAGGYTRWEAYIRCTLGEHLVMQGHVDEGYAHLQQAVAASRKGEDPLLTSVTLSTLGRALRHLGQLEKAQVYLRDALRVAQEAALLGPCKLAHQELSGVLAQRQEYRAALQHFQQYHELAMKVQLEESRRHAQLLVLQQDLDREREQSEAQRRVNRELREAHARMQEQAAQLSRLANEDPLTGLANRRQFLSQLAESLTGDQAVAVMLVDVDHFKRINDKYGHPAGDQVLRRLGQILQQHTRVKDVVARIGGEEFAVLLKGTLAAAARTTAERMRAAVAQEAWPILTEGEAVTVSVGVAHSEDGRDERQLMVLGDRRLYRAKHQGRNQVV
ncbi:tetratricopeptide repeat-containing diguanylate cyclase [Deinococcus hopiensis]|uniref:Diguanylate cyclase (GGDEF) domain-containing protein n=1 Tax=Deinococcus hopiensis KR-140 TaxID=695939 RepID=A0A1W1UPX3_9DEIO|nr:diguanylate cyclase [Deinococcus hopiensis]SMB82851.1 diguanylate cyclase (GGDEF) domain-containing protein [Deinococcus hopiensis KR-140]